MDRENGIYHRDNGDIIVQGAKGLPLFTGVMQATVAAVIERVRAIEPGDVLIVNDPYLGGTHLMDVRLLRPVFREGRVWTWLATCGPWADIGGSVAGGFSSTTTEVHQQGWRFPPIRTCVRGTLDRELLHMIIATYRFPEVLVRGCKPQPGPYTL